MNILKIVKLLGLCVIAMSIGNSGFTQEVERPEQYLNLTENQNRNICGFARNRGFDDLEEYVPGWGLDLTTAFVSSRCVIEAIWVNENGGTEYYDRKVRFLHQVVHYNGLPKPFAISVIKHLLQNGDIEAFKFLVVERYIENKDIMGSNYEPNLLDEIKDSYYFAERIGREDRMERLKHIGWFFCKRLNKYEITGPEIDEIRAGCELPPFDVDMVLNIAREKQ